MKLIYHLPDVIDARRAIVVSGVEQGKQCASLPLYDCTTSADYVD